MILYRLFAGGNHDMHGGVGGGATMVGVVGGRPHEVFNPGYSRTSSTNSIPGQHPNQNNTLRSR